MRLNVWDVLAPHALVGFRCDDSSKLSAFEAELSLIAGVKRRKGSYLWIVPENALVAVNTLQGRYGIEITSAEWKTPPPPQAKWDVVKSLLEKGGEVRPQYLDGFLTKYQMEGIARDWWRNGVSKWYPAGSGKTAVSLLLALSVPGMVVVVTRSAARLQFARQVRRFLTLDPLVYKPDSLRRKKDLSFDEYIQACKLTKQRPLVITSWDSLGDQLPSLLGNYIGCVILDECHWGKSSKRWDVCHLEELPDDEREAKEQVRAWEVEARAKHGFIKQDETGRYKMFLPLMTRAAAAARLARQATKRVALTATPVADRVRDLWAQLDMVEPNAHGNATQWLNRYAARRPGRYGGFDTRGQSNIEELSTRLKCCTHILTEAETHADLPPKRRESFYVAPEDQVMEAGGFKRLLASAKGPSGILEARLMQAASRKRKAVLTLVETHLDSDHKVVLFTGRRRDCDKLGEDVKKMKEVKRRSIQVWAAHGDNTFEERDEIAQAFMAHPGPCVLVATGHSFGTALDLNDADAAIMVMLPVTPEQLKQWEGRFLRLSSKKPVIIYYAIAEGTVDEHWATNLIEKLPVVEKIVNDKDLSAAAEVIAGLDEDISDEDFAKSILDNLDFGDGDD